jgi:phosphate transport system ATP-binding protein
MQQAARVSDQTAFFLNGNLVETSGTHDFFNQPQTEESENYLAGKFG